MWMGREQLQTHQKEAPGTPSSWEKHCWGVLQSQAKMLSSFPASHWQSSPISLSTSARKGQRDSSGEGNKSSLSACGDTWAAPAGVRRRGPVLPWQRGGLENVALQGRWAEITGFRSCGITTGEWLVITALVLNFHKVCPYTDMFSSFLNQADCKKESLHLLNSCCSYISCWIYDSLKQSSIVVWEIRDFSPFWRSVFCQKLNPS